jgi:GNAT superfamily N-acetyltransferase
MDRLLELAENANTSTPLGPHDERVVTDRYVLWMGRGNDANWNVAQRLRLAAGDVAEVRSEIHALLRDRGRTECTWEVGTHATPLDLVEQLLALGLVDDEPTPLAVGMVLTAPPAEAPPDVEVRRIETRDEQSIANAIASAAFCVPAPEPPADWRPSPHTVGYLALLDGEPVASATAAFGEDGVTLFGGATLPEARGRGAYRALVAARWADAVARGTPALVTQASPMSRPILRRLGFREVCEIRILVDRFGAAESAT